MSLIATYYSRSAVCSFETRVTRVRNRPFASHRSTTIATQRRRHTPGLETKKETRRVCRDERERERENSPRAESPSPRHLPFRANQLHSRPAALFLVNTKRHRELWGFHQPPNGFAATRQRSRSKRSNPACVTFQKKFLPPCLIIEFHLHFTRDLVLVRKNTLEDDGARWKRVRDEESKLSPKTSRQSLNY